MANSFLEAMAERMAESCKPGGKLLDANQLMLIGDALLASPKAEVERAKRLFNECAERIGWGKLPVMQMGDKSGDPWKLALDVFAKYRAAGLITWKEKELVPLS